MTWLDSLTLDTVIVHTSDGNSFRGLRSAVHDDCLVLREAVLLEAEAQSVLNGYLVIPREKVSFMQLINVDGGA